MTPEENLDKYTQILLDKIQDSQTINLKQVHRAIEFGKIAHEGQYRKGGDLFFIHPVRVALKAIEYDLDTKTVVASLLHDVVEDTPTTARIIRKHFGKTVANLVEALTKVKEDKKLTLYKIFQLGNNDFRVILIKLLDRLDNLSDIDSLPRIKQRRICQETSTIYTEVAHGLGLLDIEEQMQDLIFQKLYPTGYERVTKQLKEFYKSREVAIGRIINGIQSALSPTVRHRVSPLYVKAHQFIYNRQEIQRILDSVIIETDTPIHCYQVLGEIHTKLRSVPLTIRDYISNPKVNGWRGLSTKVIVNGEQVEIFIVTTEFHQNNRRGVITLINEGIYRSSNYREFLQLYLDVARSSTGRIEDVFRHNKANTIQTFTPAGDIIELRYGATILDFAFTVHSELGLQCSGGLINHVRYPRNKILEDGMIIKVLTSDSIKPEKSWLNDVVMPKSRKEILKYTSKH